MGMGYQGYARFYNDARGGTSAGNETSVVVLCTGASVNMVLEPIYSSGVWGAGWYNAADSAHYADNAIRYEGNIETELQVGTLGAYWNLIQDFAIAHRAYPKSLEISPDGAHVYKYLVRPGYDVNTEDSYNRDEEDYTHGAYCSSINFSTSAGSVVSSSVGVVAIYREETNPAGETATLSSNVFENYSYIEQARGVIGGNVQAVQTMAPLNPNATNINPIPYWRTNAKLFTDRGKGNGPDTIAKLLDLSHVSTDADYIPQDGLETVEWNIDVSNNQQILYTCCGSRLPRAVLMGPMAVSGAVTLYHPEGVFDPVTGPHGGYDIEHPYMTAQNTWFNVEINIDTGKSVYINVPAVVIESDDYSIKGADQVTNRAFNIKGLGGRCLSDTAAGDFVLPPCFMSKYSEVQLSSSSPITDIMAVPWTYNSGSDTYEPNPSGYEPAASSSNG